MSNAEEGLGGSTITPVHLGIGTSDGGATVTIRGSGFTGALQVVFGTEQAKFSLWASGRRGIGRDFQTSLLNAIREVCNIDAAG